MHNKHLSRIKQIKTRCYSMFLTDPCFHSPEDQTPHYKNITLYFSLHSEGTHTCQFRVAAESENLCTLLPQTSNSTSSGRNNIWRGLSAITIWKPRLKARNWRSVDLFSRKSAYKSTNSWKKHHIMSCMPPTHPLHTLGKIYAPATLVYVICAVGLIIKQCIVKINLIIKRIYFDRYIG